jgi:regulatory protein
VRRKSRASAADRPEGTPPPDAHALALQWLSARELSSAQIRTRLRRRGVADDLAEAAIARLAASGALDDARVARSAARLETAVRGRGPTRVRLKLQQLGLPSSTIDAALATTLAEVDVSALLDKAVERRLRREGAGRLDAAATRRVVGSLVRQGFAAADVLARLRTRGTATDDLE